MKKVSILVLITSFFLTSCSFNTSKLNPESIDIIVELWQSNMEGRDGDIEHPDYPFLSKNGYWYDGKEQYNISTTRGDAIKGSHANYFAEKYFELTGTKVVLIESATGSSGLTQTSNIKGTWSDTGTLWSSSKELINNALDFYKKKEPAAILLCGGENDAVTMDLLPEYTKSIVKEALQDWINRILKEYPNTNIVISELGAPNPDTHSKGWADMRAIQNEIAQENKQVFIGFSNAKNFTSEGKMSDQYHYNYKGYKEIGESLAIFLNELKRTIE